MKIKKNFKGGSKKEAGAKGKKGKETDEERQMRLEIKMLKDEENARLEEERRRNQLRDWQEEEERYSRLNRFKINNQWRKLMRLAKVESLRKDLEILSQSHEREVDMKDAIIQMLDRDLDEAEEQYSMALRSHLQNVDALIDLHNTKIRTLESEFENELALLQKEFETERIQIINQHTRDKKELVDIMNYVENEFNDQESDARQEFESHCEEMKNKALEDLNLLKMMLEANIEELERHFESAFQNYQNSTDHRTQQFRVLTLKDHDSAKQIDRQTRRLQRLQDSLANWKLKISANVRECEERNRLLREEKASILQHFQALKAKMNKFRDTEGRFLAELTQKSRDCGKTLESHLFLAEKILKLAELNRKMETEREKVLPFHPIPTSDADCTIPEEFVKEANALQSYARDQDGKIIEEWNYLDNFFKLYNKVLLDRVAISQDKAEMNRENTELRHILKQYLDGISVNEDVLSQANPLLVINNESNIHQQSRHAYIAQERAKEGVHVTVVEGNTAVNQAAKMRG